MDGLVNRKWVACKLGLNLGDKLGGLVDGFQREMKSESSSAISAVRRAAVIILLERCSLVLIEDTKDVSSLLFSFSALAIGYVCWITEVGAMSETAGSEAGEWRKLN